MLGRLLDDLRQKFAARKQQKRVKVASRGPLSIDALLAQADYLSVSGDHARAEAAYREALTVMANHPGALHGLGLLALMSGNARTAVDLFSAAIASDPKVAAHHNNCGEAYRKLGENENAIACYRDAIRIAPDYGDAYLNLGLALQAQGRLAEAIQALEKAVELSPDEPEAHIGLSLALLASGDYARGWKGYAWRRARRGYQDARPRLRSRQWDGRPLPNGIILLYVEQGYGDAIQFVRYAPMVAERCARVILKCHDALESLFETLSDRVEVIPGGTQLPHYDAHASLLDLPAIFGTTLDCIPVSVPYLRAPVERVRAWQRRIDASPGVLRLGLTWAGSPKQGNDRNRSCTLSDFARLAEVDGIIFYALQKECTERGPTWPLEGSPLFNLGPDIKDFSDTAAIIENLDMVVSVDTSVAHLAGALGRPVWTVLAFAPDWRYLTQCVDSPWYPTMRVFRQPRPGAWSEVLDDVAIALKRERSALAAGSLRR